MVLHGVALWHSNHSNTHFYDLIHLCRGLSRPKCQIICSRRQSCLNAAGGGAGWFFNVFHGTPKKSRLKTQVVSPVLKMTSSEKKNMAPSRELCRTGRWNRFSSHQPSPGSQWTRNSLLGSQITTAGLSSVRLPDPLDIVSGAIWCDRKALF